MPNDNVQPLTPDEAAAALAVATRITEQLLPKKEVKEAKEMGETGEPPQDST